MKKDKQEPINSIWYFRKNLKYIVNSIIIIACIIFVVIFGTFLGSDVASALNNTIDTFLDPLVGFLVAVITFLAFFVQYVANERFQEQFKIQQSSDHFYKMLDIHIQNVDNFSIKSYRNENEKTGQYEVTDSTGSKHIIDDLKELSSILLITVDPRNNRKLSIKEISKRERIVEKTSGKETFLLMSKDLHFTIETVIKLNKHLDDVKNTGSRLTYKQALRLSYSIFFWGIKSTYIWAEGASKKRVDIIKNEIEKKYDIYQREKGNLIRFNYLTSKRIPREEHLRIIPFSGHASMLAHYYRHLYQTVKYIHISFESSFSRAKSKFEQNEIINNRDLQLDTLRAQLSNEEQLLLYYNYRIGFGPRWDKRYKDEGGQKEPYYFLSDYKMIHNIPLNDTIHFRVEHPLEHWKKYIKEKQALVKGYSLFEWAEGIKID